MRLVATSNAAAQCRDLNEEGRAYGDRGNGEATEPNTRDAGGVARMWRDEDFMKQAQRLLIMLDYRDLAQALGR